MATIMMTDGVCVWGLIDSPCEIFVLKFLSRPIFFWQLRVGFRFSKFVALKWIIYVRSHKLFSNVFPSRIEKWFFFSTAWLCNFVIFISLLWTITLLCAFIFFQKQLVTFQNLNDKFFDFTVRINWLLCLQFYNIIKKI